MVTYESRVWKFGDNISTDLIMPTFTMYGKMNREEMKNFCLQPERAEFAKNVKNGDIIVAGKNFGCGSSRPAATNFIDLGVKCAIVESAAAIFFRNSISMGFQLIICPGITDFFEDGDRGDVDLSKGKIVNLNNGKILKVDPYPPFLLNIINEGGILTFLRQGKSIAEV